MKKINITPDTNINDIQNKLIRSGVDAIFVDEIIKNCQTVYQHVRNSYINNPQMNIHITKTVIYNKNTIIIIGSLKKENLLKIILKGLFG